MTIIIIAGIALLIYGMMMLVGLLTGNPTWWNPFAKRPDRRYLDFSTSKNLYTVAPDKWTLDKSDFSAKYDTSRFCGDWFYMHGLSDKIRFWRFANEIEIGKANASEKELMEKIIESWQEDIDKFKEQYKK